MNEKSLMMDPEVQTLVQYMVERGEYTITPKVDSKGISFSALSSVFPTKTDAEISTFLEKLSASKILISKLLDKLIICPTCGSASVYSRYNCPRCSSFDIGKASIIEHIRCGYIGSKEAFQKDNLLICPKCRNTVSEIDYRKIGTSFQCSSCGSRFEAPRVSHKCNSCEAVFTYKEAKYESVYQYELSEEAKRTMAKGTVPLSSIASSLRERGFEVGLKQEIVGKSGATHSFDVVAKKDKALVVANFSFEPKEEDIIGIFAKKYDVDPTHTLLITLSLPTKEQEAVSKAYGVQILSSASGTPIADQIENAVEEFLNRSASSSAHETDIKEEAKEEPKRSDYEKSNAKFKMDPLTHVSYDDELDF